MGNMYVVMNKSKDRISTENKHMIKYIMRKIDQRPNGFMFRVGVSPSFNFGDKYGLNKAAFFPYIGFGWLF